MIKLTATQQKICWCMMQGYSLKETAFTLNRSVGTIKTQRHRIAKKIGWENVNQITPIYYQIDHKNVNQMVSLTVVFIGTNGKMLVYNNANGDANRNKGLDRERAADNL